MQLQHRIFAGAAALLTILGATGCAGGGDGAAEAEPLRMGVVPSETVAETSADWGYLIDRIEERTGYTIELFEASDLAAVTEAAIAGDLDIIHLGPFGHLIAHDNGAEISTVGATAPTAAGVDNASVAVVRDDSAVTELEDLRGQDICFMNPSSATGYLFGAAAFLELGIDPETDINPIFVGDHASAVRTMYDGECAAAFTNRDYAENVFYDDNPDADPDDLRIVWREEAPEGGVAISTQLPADVQEKLREALLGINGTEEMATGDCPSDRVVDPDDGGEPFCGTWPNQWWGLVEQDDTYWEPIRVVCEATEAPACAG